VAGGKGWTLQQPGKRPITNPDRPLRIALTGGPGAGRILVIAALGSAGHRTVPEAGRGIIRERIACGGLALPWADLALYADRMIAADIAAFHSVADAAGPVFFDQVLALGHLRLEPLPVPDAACAAFVAGLTR
jgi:predicted ATPase